MFPGDVLEQKWPSMAGAVRADPTGGTVGARGNLMNMQEQGGHDHQRLTYSRIELLDERNGGRMMEFDGGMVLGAPVTGGRGILDSRLCGGWSSGLRGWEGS